MHNKILTKIEFIKSIFLPYTNKVYIVGGFVRDKLLGIDSQDIDIEVHQIDIKVFQKIMKQINALEVGKSFFVYKYQDIDISLPRIENKIGIGHKGFQVKLAKNEKEASLRKDFTILVSLCYPIRECLKSSMKKFSEKLS